MKVCLIPLILYMLAISDPPSLKFFMNLNQFSHQYAPKQLHTFRPHLLYLIVFFAGGFLHIFLARDEVGLWGGGLGNGSSAISSLPPPYGLPGVPDSAEASGIIRAPLHNL